MNNSSTIVTEEICQTLFQHAVEVWPSKEAAYERLIRKKKWVVKFGVDPSAPYLHLGHFLILKKMKQLQSMGHEAVFLIGDFTAMIGDPSGKNKTRPMLKREEVAQNTKEYIHQVQRIFKPEHIRMNSEWFDASSIAHLLEWASQFTIARMLERDDFWKRYEGKEPINVQEFLYPVLQGYDSVALEADLEIGGTDQSFNMLMGRDLQKKFGQEPQIVMTFPLLVGLDGVHKMSKSLHNSIDFTDSPKDMFGKLMSIPDGLMDHYARLLDTTWMLQDFEHPRDAKEALALDLTCALHGLSEALDAKESFSRMFRDKNVLPEDLEILTLTIEQSSIGLLHALKSLGKIQSTSEGMRLIRQKGLDLDHMTLHEQSPVPQLYADHSYVCRIGKHRHYRIIIHKDKPI